MRTLLLTLAAAATAFADCRFYFADQYDFANNLGFALVALGERERGTARLEEAIAAYDGALTIFVAAHADYYVSICRKNLADVRTALDKRKG